MKPERKEKSAMKVLFSVLEATAAAAPLIAVTVLANLLFELSEVPYPDGMFKCMWTAIGVAWSVLVFKLFVCDD